MAGPDNIKINSIERALGSDINDAQSMLSRLVCDVVQRLASYRNVMASGGAFDTFPSSYTMGFGCRGNGSSITVSPGILFQYSATVPAAPGALESLMRIGILRNSVNVSFTATPNSYNILEAKIQDLVTTNVSRDVFNTTTQVFTPTNVDKQQERRVQFQVVQHATKLPLFTGGDWIPIIGFTLDGAGACPTLPSTFFWDMRPDLKDSLVDIPYRSVPDVAQPDAYIEHAAVHSRDSGYSIGGNFFGQVGSNRVWLRADNGLAPVVDSTTPAAANAAEYLYLAPLSNNGVTIYPVVGAAGITETSRGILVRSTAAVAEEGPENRATLTWAAGSVYGNYAANVVGLKKAICVATCYQNRLATGYEPFSTSAGGKTLLRLDPTPTTAPLVGIATRATASLTGSTTLTIDMRNKIPRNARIAWLNINIDANSGTAGRYVSYALRRLSGTTYKSGQVMCATVTDSYVSNEVIPVPVKTSLLDGALEGNRWEIALTASATLNTGCIVNVIGWET